MATQDALLSAALKSMSYVVVADEHCNIVYIDQEYQQMLGVTDATCIGRPVLEVIPDSGIPHVARTRQAEFGRLYQLRNGPMVVVNRFPILVQGRFAGVVTTASFSQLDMVEPLQQQIEKLRADNQSYKKQLLQYLPGRKLDSIITVSRTMQQVKESIKQIAPSSLPVLICGETGTGKELVADALHDLSARRHEPMIKISCASIPPQQLAWELFGSVRDASTGRFGKLQQARNGTVLLDEITELPLELQAKLLRALQENERGREAANDAPQPARILCTSNRDMNEAMEKGAFRRDLYFMLNVVEIDVPPLRDRLDDLPALCRHFLSETASTHGLAVDDISPDALQLLSQYRWPGNVRELRHAVERACLVAGSGTLENRHFEFLLPRISSVQPPKGAAYTSGLELALGALEQSQLADALQRTGGNKSAAAKLLGIDRASLYRKLKKYGMDSSSTSAS